MLNLRPYLVVAALAVASPVSAETLADPTADAHMAASFATAMTTHSDDVVFHRLIEFAPASARVYSVDRELLDRMAKTWLRSGQLTMITVHGYTESLDLRLAERRAQIIRGYLVKSGVSPARVITVGHTLDKDGRRIDLAIGRCSREQCPPNGAER